MSHRPYASTYEIPQAGFHPSAHARTGHDALMSRDHGGRIPILNTLLPNAQPGSYNPTPLTAGPSPFPLDRVSPVSPLPPSASRGVSPMVNRISGNFSVPYNPGDWTSNDAREVRANVERRAREQNAEDGLADAPPPYSPSGEQGPTSANVQQGAPTVLGSSMLQAQQITSQPTTPPATTHARPRANHYAHGNNRHSMYSITPPPPPSGNHPMSQGATMNIASRLGDAYGQRDDVSNINLHAPAARRATSASAQLDRHIATSPSSRSASRQRNWQPGMPLPGPPPGPPPSASRSQSINAPERSDASSSHHARNFRRGLQTTDLGPVPPTPAGWTEDQPLPSHAHHNLHIDTNISQRPRSQTQSNTNQTAGQSPAGTPGSGGPSLSRSSAIRDSSIKGLRERRAQNRNSRAFAEGEMHALSVQTGDVDSPLPSGNLSAGSYAEPASGGGSARLRPKPLSPLSGGIIDNRVTPGTPQKSFSPPVVLPTLRTSIGPGPSTLNQPPKSLPTPPLSQKAPMSAHSILPSSRGSFSGRSTMEEDEFTAQATRRYTDFLRKESDAHTDDERLRLFSDFILSEAAIRYQRYEAAIHSGHFDLQSVRDRLFTPQALENGHSELEESQSLAATPRSAGRPDASHRNNDYEPVLSPILSNDEDSRGRAPSRWWESQTGSQNGDRAANLQRTKRESKYMGLSKQVLMSSPWDEERGGHTPNNSVFPNEKANPESFGFYEEPISYDLPSNRASKAPATPSLLDISRFITLPPPYPRHYPAVSNSHPDLAQYRTTVRTLSDLEDISTRKARHKGSAEAQQNEHRRKLSDGRRVFRSNVQAQIQEGSISFAEAAEAEEAYKQTEFELEKRNLQEEFDTLQDVVINPLHDMLHARIEKLDSNIQQLLRDLDSDAEHQDPDRPQEEGDEKPELLEKLTQLKWLFDTREQMHKESFEILSQRNDTYKAIVLLPYRFSGSHEKVADTESFFQRDAQTRHATFCRDSFTRHDEFLKIVDEHVRRGVELQSSAFWDIAPSLLDLLQKIPENVHDLPGVHIPADEYEENPSYYQHPQQYLYSLLSHAEKSTYQFIEGQVNLHCLLHEVNTARLASQYRTLEAESPNSGATQSTLSLTREREESHLTAELKQKASMIEEQWLEALGSQLQGTRERVKALLMENDAWDEIAVDET